MFMDIDDAPLSLLLSSVGNGCSPGSMGRFKAEESCSNLGILNPDAGKSIPASSADLLSIG